MDRGAPHHLVFVIAEGEDRGYDHALPGVDPHRVHVLHTADDDAGIGGVPHDLELNLFPPHDALFDQDLVDAGAGEAELDDPGQFLPGLADTSPSTPQRVRGADYRRKTDLLYHFVDLGHGVEDHALRDRFSDGSHEVPEFLPVLPLVDRIERCAEDLHVFEGPHLGEFCRQVQAGLASHAGEDTVRFLFLDDPGDDIGPEGLDIDLVRHLRVGHDRGRVGVDQHDLHSLLPHGTAGLRPGEVEFGCLADLDGSRSDQKDFFNVRPARHQAILRNSESKKCASVSRGPPWASGWNWTVVRPRSLFSNPSTVPSLTFV